MRRQKETEETEGVAKWRPLERHDEAGGGDTRMQETTQESHGKEHEETQRDQRRQKGDRREVLRETAATQ